MRLKKTALSLLLTLAMVVSLFVPALAAQTGDIVVLYTNDVHTYIDKTDAVTYSKVAALKDTFDNVVLVDAGDAIQGTAYGSMDKGESIIKMMNAAGYDLATLGNHEFDYGMAGCMQAMEWADFPYVSCNFYHEKDGVAGDTVLDSYKVFEMAGVKVAFVGITTPESFTKSTPAYFQDENGNYIYGIAGGTDGSALYAAVQKAIDAASAEADYVIALGHLGVDPSSQPWTSEEVIANTTGLDAFIDGHSHSTVESRAVTDKGGNTVVLTQTGSYLDSVGKLTISPDGTITTELLSGEDLANITPDADVKALEESWIDQVNTELGQVIGSIDDTLDNYDADGNRLVRKQETNTGDFAADALYYLFESMDLDVDVAIMNGGGIRNEAITGDISYLTCKSIHTFGNVACLQTVTGQQLLDALEWGAKDAAVDGSMESGGFLQVSGLRYTISLRTPSTVQKDDKGVWTGGPTGEYRVRDVEILNKETGEYEPLDLTASYNLAGYNYTLRDLGDGFAMFDGAINVVDYVMEDYMVLANYVQSFEGGKVTGYSDVNGQGRITLDDSFLDVAADAWYAQAVDYVTDQGIFAGTSGTTFSPNLNTTRAMLVTVLYRMSGSDYTGETTFADVPADTWYSDAVAWAQANKLVNGRSSTTFDPNGAVTRQEAAKIIFNYVKLMGLPAEATGDLSTFSDCDAVADWAVEGMSWAVGLGILQGMPGNQLAPGGTATRAQAATILWRLMG